MRRSELALGRGISWAEAHSLRSFPRRAAAGLLCAVGLLASACSNNPVTPTPGAPTLSCPANITMSGVTGATRTVSYSMPVISGGAQPVTVSCMPASGSPFPTGATVVNCTATDALQRQATCSFSVTLDPLVIGVRQIVAFGDSVTAGEDGRALFIRVHFVDPVRSYPAVLQATLLADFPSQTFVVANEGLGGEFVTNASSRLQDVLQRLLPDTLLLLHGYNDLLNRGVGAVNDVVSALRGHVRTARGRGVARVFVSTLTPSRPATGPRNRAIDPRAIQEANAKLTEMAAAEAVTLVATYDAFLGREPELVGDDGLHLTIAGNEVLAATFYRAIRESSR